MLRDLLSAPSLGLSLLVDGDLDRPVRWVHVCEITDASPYLEGDELILTTGVWRRRGTSALDFVRALETKSVAGLGYGLLNPGDTVPQSLIRACRGEGVPLVLVPTGTPFIAISQWFVERLHEEREAELRASLAFMSDLVTSADSTDPATGLKAVARILRQETGHGVWIADGTGHLLARAGRVPDAEQLKAAVRNMQGAPGLGADAHVRCLRSGSRITALIGLTTSEPGIPAQARLEAAVPVVGLVLARERTIRETERRLAGELVSLILARQEQAAAARMTSYGLDPQQPNVAIVAAVADAETALGAAERWLDTEDLNGVVAQRGSELHLIVDDGSTAVPCDVYVGRLVRAVKATGAGIGIRASDIRSLRISLIQARQACELALRRGGGTVVSQQLAGRHSLLLALQDPDVLDSFRDALLTPLEAHDTKHSGELVPTLRAFLASGGRWQQTADRLNIHVNTLRHRLARVEEITGRRLDDTSDRVDLWLAMETPHMSPY
ncbi:PucR family transcriptional regulator [Streptomyces sp. NPDC048297]|uniref:PucR family transcriptional regulator n=1 Tax=Streptomyces sp. NPDC048297 TaxID=3365531 RepID=UPI00372245BB